MPCKTLRHAHMCTRIQSDCTCHLSWIVLPLPHFVLPVHHLYSSSADSWKDSWETLLSVCVKGFRPAAWRRFAHPPLSSAEPSVLYRDSWEYTLYLPVAVFECVCGQVYTLPPGLTSLSCWRKYFSVCPLIFLFPVGRVLYCPRLDWGKEKRWESEGMVKNSTWHEHLITPHSTPENNIAGVVVAVGEASDQSEVNR